MKNLSSAFAIAAVLACASAHAAPVVWDQGFGKGVTGLDWIDQSNDQNMADSVTFAQATSVSGYNFFSGSDLSAYAGSSDFQLRIWSNSVVRDANHQNQDQPNQVLVTEDIGFTAQNQVCSACVPGGDGSFYDGFKLSFSFAPIKFDAGTTYWIGLSGNGFDADMLSVIGAQDNSMAQFDGDRFAFIASGANGDFIIGDQMFQLTGVVPEPANIALIAAGLALVGFAARRKRRG